MSNFQRRLTEKLIYLYWWCESQLEYFPSGKTGINSKIFFEPTTITIVSLIVSAALTATSTILSYALRPKTPAQPKQKFGDYSISDSDWGIPIKRIHGHRSIDNTGGVEIGTNYIFCSDIRRTEVQVPGTTSSSGNSGGKGFGGGSKTSTQTETHLSCDFAALIGAGRLRLLRVKANEDIIFENSQTLPGTVEPAGTKYEAESGTRTGTAAIISESAFSSGQGVNALSSTGTLTLTLSGGSADGYSIHIGYKSATDVTCQIEVSGETFDYTFPATGAARGFRSLLKGLPSATNSFKFKNASASGLKIDAVYVETPVVIETPEDIYYPPSGVYDEQVGYFDYKDNYYIPARDYRTYENFNRVSLPVYADANGILTASLANGANMAFYPGSETQPVDSVISAWVASQAGKTAAYCPAFLGYSYVRFQNFDFTKYGYFPNIRVLVENMDTGTVEEILLAEVGLLSGLTSDDFDFSAASAMSCRGYLIAENAQPAKAFEDMALLFNLSYAETNNAKLTAINKSIRTSVATISKDKLGAYLLEEKPPQDDVKTTSPEENGMPMSLELQFINPLAPINYGTDRRAHIFPFTDSTKKDSVSINATMLPDESQLIVKRLNQEKWLKLAPHKFTLTHEYAWLDAGNCIFVEIDNEYKLVRIEEKQGAAPGIFEITATNDELYVSADGTISTIERPKGVVFIPAATVGTLMELPPLYEAQSPGLQIACAKSGPGNWRGAALYRQKGEEWQRLVTFNKSALMGRAINALATAPSGYVAGDIDSTHSITVDFFNDFTPDVVTIDAQADGANLYIIGSEIVYVRTWTRDNAYANRWVGTNLIRRGKNTLDTGHAISERVVYFTDAVKFLAIEPEEIGVERTWKFVSDGESLADASPILFTWTGGAPPPKIADVVLTGQNELLNDQTIVHSVFGEISFGESTLTQRAKIFWQRPGASSFELLTEVTPDADLNAEFRAVNLALGTHNFKIFAVNASSVAQLETPTVYTVTISVADFLVNGKIVENAVDRTFTGIDASGQYRGRDTAVVPLSVITASVIKSVVFDNGINVDLNVAGEVTNAKVLQSSQGDSIFQSKVIIYNKFGELVKTLVPDGFTGAGTLGKGTIARKYADPLEEAIFKIHVRNYQGWSLPKYLKGSTLSDSMPSVLSRSNVVQDLIGSPISSSSINFAGTFTFSSNTLKLQKRYVGQTAADWVDHATGITALPYTATGLPENTDFEFRMISSANAAYISNIARASTYPQNQTAPTYPAPISLTGSQDSTTPTTKLNFSFIAKGNVATQVWVNGANVSSDVSAVAVDATGSFSRTSLTPDTNYLVKVRHDYGSGHYSDFSAEITVRTAATPPSETAPTIDSVSYSTPNQRVTVAFTPGAGGSGNFTVEWSATETGSYTALSPTVSASPKTDDVAQTGSIQTRWYRVKRTAGYSAPVSVSIPAVDSAQSPINLVVDQPTDGLAFDISWDDRGATGSNKLEISPNGSSSWTTVYSAASTPTTHTPPSASNWYYRISNSAIPGVYAYSGRVRWFA